MSVSITVCTAMDVAPGTAWAEIEDIASHEEWMADAEQITFRTDQRTGVGTVFECRTRLGPIVLRDVLEVTEWEPGAVMGIVHKGAVTGTGRFTLRDDGRGATRFCWTEELWFPWWLAGNLGARVGAPVLRRIWSRNLDRLRSRVERR